jgi:hypothetical protein
MRRGLHVQTLRQQGQRFLDLVNRILDFCAHGSMPLSSRLQLVIDQRFASGKPLTDLRGSQ